MKAIILAAGQGTRLRPLTDDKPKCMVEYQNKPIITYILQAMKTNNIDKIAIVNGYKKEVLEAYLANKNISFYSNKNFTQTNMVSSLFCAEDFMDDDLIISYADIIYDSDILQKLIHDKNDFSVVVDKKWKELWTQRMENPLEDAETLKIKDKKIIELGKKPNNYDEIEGQYIGLIKISKKILPKIIMYYKSLDMNSLYDSQNHANMYMTTFIQLIINNLLDVKPIIIHGGWLEIDTTKDLDTTYA